MKSSNIKTIKDSYLSECKNQDYNISLFIVSYFLVQIANLTVKTVLPIPLKYYSLISFSFGLILVVLFLKSIRIVINRSLLPLIFIESFTICLFLLSLLLQNAEKSLLTENFIWGVFISIPLSIYAYSLKDSSVLYKVFLKYSVIMSFMLLSIVFSNSIVEYSMSFSYALVLPLLFQLNEWFNNKKITNLIIIILQVFAIFLYGSRGALISILAYLILRYFFGNTKVVKKLIVGVFLFLIGFVIYLNFSFIGKWILGILSELGMYSRTLTLIFTNNITHDAGRAEIFRHYFELIKEKPLTGWGLLGGWLGKGLGPHNMIIETFLSFGIIIGSLILIVIVLLQLRIFFVKEQLQRELLLIFMSSIIVLFFVSGDFIQKPNLFILIGLLSNNLLRKQSK